MEQLETKAGEFAGKAELRCKGWCHDRAGMTYQAELPNTEYFN